MNYSENQRVGVIKDILEGYKAKHSNVLGNASLQLPTIDKSGYATFRKFKSEKYVIKYFDM